jgi:hypothetical protein
MEFLIRMSKQPLFRLIGAILVLLMTDMHPVAGIVAAVAWITWVVWSNNATSRGLSYKSGLL